MALLGMNRGNLMECQEFIENITSSESNLVPDMRFNGHCLIKNNISIPEKVINLYISYMLNPWLRNLNTDFTVKNYYLDL